MSTTAQKEKRQVDVLRLVAEGVRDVDTLIDRRHGARISTLSSINDLIRLGKLGRMGNTLFIPLVKEN